jgi:hypothetical protein
MDKNELGELLYHMQNHMQYLHYVTSFVNCTYSNL